MKIASFFLAMSLVVFNLVAEEIPLDAKIYVAGHNGLVGSTIVKQLRENGYNNLIFRSSHELDLRNQKDTLEFFENERPEYVFLCAAKVGGILANKTYPAEFAYDNSMISLNVIHSSYLTKVKKLLFLGSVCIYPKHSCQPITEDALLTASLEPTNEAYALAKILGLKTCQYYNRQFGTNFISCMPTNLYGPGDNFHPTNSHVIPALIRKFVHAKKNNASEVVIWGSGRCKREFLHVNDMASAAVFLMEHYNGAETINIGVGKEIEIGRLAELIATIVGYEGDIVYDTSKPEGVLRRVMNVDRLTDLGWEAEKTLTEGLMETVEWYLENINDARGNADE